MHSCITGGLNGSLSVSLCAIYSGAVHNLTRTIYLRGVHNLTKIMRKLHGEVRNLLCTQTFWSVHY
jgi:hypothetical protein